ncbi:hypothetical protein E2562_015130 [Oryza meyeriana var. granulata]|uniref:Uncharacterized protein n=1 Tax=Oryza meyeriana var. granulata TaxID=110450 RepID=A0A6G1DX30_9ORYZ|nr:hypothetical protein E2562_015130 [Oryza meyeriana var. granulata]
MDSEAIGCAGDGCLSGVVTWPLHHPPAHFDDGDPILAPPVPIATCRLCNEAVAHRYCLQSADAAFVCTACVAAMQGIPFSFAPATDDPHDIRE